MKAGRTGAVAGDGQRSDRERKKTATGKQERKQDQRIPSDDLLALVAARAYSLYERRGYEDGYDLEDWLEAERIILTE